MAVPTLYGRLPARTYGASGAQAGGFEQLVRLDLQRVAFDHRDIGVCLIPKAGRELRIQLDGDDAAGGGSEALGQHAQTGPYFDHGVVR